LFPTENCFSTLFLVGQHNQWFKSLDGVNWAMRNGSAPFDTYGRDITVLSDPLTFFLSGGNNAYLTKSPDFQSFFPLGSPRPIGFPSTYAPVSSRFLLVFCFLVSSKTKKKRLAICFRLVLLVFGSWMESLRYLRFQSTSMWLFL
jgi:hypothetical protein